MVIETQTIKLCILGTQAEFAGKLDEAFSLYMQAWKAAQDDYEKCISAHYVARFQGYPKEKLRWNLLALEHANLVDKPRAENFFASLYLNIGQSFESLGNLTEARKYYQLASALGFPHHED